MYGCSGHQSSNFYFLLFGWHFKTILKASCVFSVSTKWHTEVELSMSNIGSPERVDQVKPLKHSGGRPMIPSDVFCKRTRWCVLYSGGENVKWKDSRVTNERKIWLIHLELKKGKYDEICNSLQSHKGDIRTFNFSREFLEMDESTNKAEAVHFETKPGNRLKTMSCTKSIADVSSSSC